MGKTVFRDRMRTGPSRESSPSMLAQSSMSAKGPERLFPVGSILVRFALASRRVRRAQRYSGQGHERSSALRQRTSAAPPGETSAYLCIPLLSLLMPCAYARTIERRREVFILAVTPKGTNKQLTTSLSGSATNDSNRRSTAGVSCFPKSVIKITAPRSESQDCRDK